jgi:hypothetical protein
MSVSRKLKSLALILRSLPPNTQKIIFEQLPLPLVQKISDVDLSIDETLTQEDWEFFSGSWPEFAGMINKIKLESRVEQSHAYLLSERPRIREYIEYKLGKRKMRPNLSHAISRIVDEVALEVH